MKIAHVTATFPPYWAGTGNVVAQTARTLANRGHDVTVFTPRVADPIEPPDDWPFETRRLPAPLRVGNAAWTPALARVLSGFDVIHLHYPYIGGAEWAARAAGRLQVPLVLTYHNRLVSGGPLRRAAFRAYSRLVEPHVLNAADIVIAVHEDYRRAWFAARPRVRAVPHGIDAGVFRPQNRFQSRAMLGLGTEERVVLFVGALDRAHRFKNVGGLLDALARCALPLTAVLVGDGDLVPDL
ncbi:MAG: glycosyltransferase, partial [Clostridia bacterium]